MVTGTPIQNRWEDLASLLKFLQAYPDHDLSSLKALLRRGRAGSDIKSMLASLCLRRSKAVMSLPGRIDKVHYVEFNEHEAATYDHAKNGIIRYLQTEVCSAGRSYSNVLVRINTLRQLCNVGIYSQNHTQGTKISETPEMMVQDLFQNMISAGVSTCAQCGEGWSTGGDYRYSDVSSAQPHLTLCGLLLCTSCSSTASDRAGTQTSRCQHEVPCQLWPVQTVADTSAPPTSCWDEVPVKMRALKKDLLALPLSEKRSVFSLRRRI